MRSFRERDAVFGERDAVFGGARRGAPRRYKDRGVFIDGRHAGRARGAHNAGLGGAQYVFFGECDMRFEARDAGLGGTQRGLLGSVSRFLGSATRHATSLQRPWGLH